VAPSGYEPVFKRGHVRAVSGFPRRPPPGLLDRAQRETGDAAVDEDAVDTRGRDGAGQPARRSRSIRSSMGGWVMNSRISPRRVAPEMPKAAIWSGSGSRP